MEKRAYKLQEFVAHSSNVNCLSIGKKTGKVFITGGDDHKVNLWAVGKSTSLLSLSGHTSSVETVVFDSAEVLVLSGASTGAIKLWDLEEGKIVRNLTGHRLNCTAVEFHPFGEFFASGSSDANLKIWDIRKKGCLHTYKGHTQGVSTIKFSPDGRWVVSGGADNVVKIWDLTAGKLLQEFKYHVGQIRSIEFHPMEFLLATGSADRTVNFWDLETFELIGSAGPEVSGLRSMTFHPDGRTLFCGLEDKLKIFSWEPIKCHDVVDMGWSTLDDLSIHDGKLLACSHYRNCVDVWVADISLIEPHRVGGAPLSFGAKEQKFNVQEGIVNPITEKRTSPRAYEATEYRNIYVDTADSRKVAPKRIDSDNDLKVVCVLDPSDNYNLSSPTKSPGPEPRERNSSHAKSRSFTPPVVVPRNNAESTVRPRREANSTERGSPGIRREPTLARRPSSRKSDSKLSKTAEPVIVSSKKSGSDISEEPKFHFRFLSINEPTKTSEGNSISSTVADKVERTLSPDVPLSSSCENTVEVQNSNGETSSTTIVRGVAVQLGRTRSLVQRWESRDKCSNSEDLTNSALSEDLTSTSEHKGPLPRRKESSVPGKETEALDLLGKEREALDLLGKEGEALSLIEKEREASALLKKERETLALLKKEREALALLKKEREELAFLKKEREDLARLEKEKEALSLLEKEREAFALLEKEREVLAVIEKEKEASRLIEIEKEALSRMEKERETSLRMEKEREASRLIERRREASRINEKERETSRSIEKEREASRRNNEEVIDGIMQNHDIFLSDLRSRLTKLQVVRHFWLRNDVKGGIDAVGKLPDHCIQADVAAVLVEKMEIVTLDLFTCLLPLFTSLLNSDIDRHTNVSLEMLLKLVAIFGPVIRSTMSSSPSVRVDLQAERRRGLCKQCSIHLKKIKQLLPSVTRRGGSLAKGARELNLVLQEF
ncbi:hypothetical protein MKW94_025636 [Papaver nudicaule]|uniref:Katanin p80 WD40 repeat-containing subunit B1 homolog n=1 Tax=Papaver nudicaule TaxID=74823 RepID=A0AA41V7T9_PAPNU|nr:hypothetical protein [Papaver nudicaule]